MSSLHPAISMVRYSVMAFRRSCAATLCLMISSNRVNIQMVWMRNEKSVTSEQMPGWRFFMSAK